MLHIFNKNSQSRSVSFLGFFDEFLHALSVIDGTVLTIQNRENLDGLFHLFKTNFFLSLSTVSYTHLDVYKRQTSTMSIQALSAKTGLMERHVNAMSTVEILSVTVAS